MKEISARRHSKKPQQIVAVCCLRAVDQALGLANAGNAHHGGAPLAMTAEPSDTIDWCLDGVPISKQVRQSASNQGGVM
jgi:hypothetical protein